MSVTEQFAPFVTSASRRETDTRARAWTARDKVAALRTQLADAERELAQAERDSDDAQAFLVRVWDDYKALGVPASMHAGSGETDNNVQ